MSIRAAINGFGRVGRYLVRAWLGYGKEIDIVAVNSRAKSEVLAHLLKYDSVHGKISCEVGADGAYLLVNKKRILVTNVTSSLPDDGSRNIHRQEVIWRIR